MTDSLVRTMAGGPHPFTTRDALSRGVSRAVLSRAVKEGRLVRRCRGVYELPEAPKGALGREFENLLARRVPFVATLASSLFIHGLTTQVPHQIWIAVPPGTRTPEAGGAPVECVRVTEPSYSFGIVRMDAGGVEIPVYSPAKTVADCFKFRRRIGLDVAVEALHDGWRKRKFTADELMAAARVDRMERVIRPYAEGMLIP